MKLPRLITLAVLVLGAWLGMASVEQGRIGFAPAEAAQGCGVGFHRGPYGYCRPNYYRGYYVPGYYGRRYYGYRGVYYGRPYYRYRRAYWGPRYYGYRGAYYRRRY